VEEEEEEREREKGERNEGVCPAAGTALALHTPLSLFLSKLSLTLTILAPPIRSWTDGISTRVSLRFSWTMRTSRSGRERTESETP